MPKRKFIGIPFPALIGLIVFILFAIGVLAGPLGRSIVGDIGLPSWISVPQPRPELPAERIFINSPFLTNSLVAAWITVAFLIGFSLIVKRRSKMVPDRLQAAFEFLLGWLYDFCVSAAGEKNGRRFFPIVATIFLYVAFNAWMGLVPGYGTITAPGYAFHEGHWVDATVHLIRPANTDINTPLAIAIISVLFAQFYGFKELKLRYVLKFLNISTFFRGLGEVFKGKIGSGLSTVLTGLIEIFIGFLELLSEFIHIISFTFRLFGNMTAGEMLLLVAAFLIPWVFALPFYGLEMLIGFLQALIFAGLTLIFLTLAVTSHSEEH
ncbi:MAG: F0F1 ATP synthase subunit A [Dehalococcoidales bacterium]